MIAVQCSKCLAKFNAPDTSAGKTAKCSNCGNPIVIQAPGAAPPQPTVPPRSAVPPRVPAPPPPPPPVAAQTSTVPNNPGGTTVIVQMPPPVTVSVRGGIGPANKSSVAIVILWLLPIAGLPYFYLGQTGKGLVLLGLDFFVFGPLIIFSCGFGLPCVLAIYGPLHIMVLIDSLLVASRMRKGPVASWRFF